MIAYLEGQLLSWKDDNIVIFVNGVGYRVFVPASVFKHLPSEGEMVSFFIHTIVREDAITLYGFLTEEELELFKQLITVTGVGPKVATGILSSLEIPALKRAIIYEDVSVLKKIPGIGEKSAKRLILELKNKINFSAVDDNRETGQQLLTNSVAEEATDALIALGYSRSEALSALQKVGEGDDLQVLIKKALKILGQGRS